MDDITTIRPEDVPAEPKILSKLGVDAVSWFEAREDGLWFIEKKEKEGKAFMIPTRLTFEPFEVIGRLVPIDGDNQRGLLVRLSDREVTVPRADVSREADVATWMADHGVRFDSRKKSLLALYFSMADASTIRAYTRNGWQRDGAFVIGDRIIRGEGSVLRTEQMIIEYESRGTFEEWRDEVLPLLERKPGWMFGVLVALSSPLMRQLGIETGSIYNVTGSSRTGKTIVLKAAASVWGRPDAEGALMTFETTENAIEGLAEGASDIGLFLDEMERADPELITKVVYKFANGQGKKRMKSSGEMQRRRHWLANALVSSEKTIEGMFDAKGTMQAAGQVVRALDIAGDAILPMLPIEQVNEVERALRRIYGTAGPELVRRVMDLDLYDQHAAAMRALYDGEDGRIQTVAGSLALLVVAGEVMGIDVSVVKDVFDRWLDKDAQDALQVDHAVARHILDFIDSHMNSTILPIADDDDDENAFDAVTSGEAGGSSRERDGWYDDEYAYLLASRVKALLGGHGRSTFYQWCRERDLIKDGADNRGTVYVPKIKPRKQGVAFHLDRLREIVG